MKKLFSALLLLFAVALGIFLVLTAANPLPKSQLAALNKGDAKAGERMFWAGGCASCHAAPGAKGEGKLVLAGGLALKTPFGTFRAPNISPNKKAGIGGWSLSDFANAMKRGLSPSGEHYYPAFPYTSYARMKDDDIADLWEFLKTLPKSEAQSAAHELSFPFNVRRGLGLWKRLYLSEEPVITSSIDSPQLELGRYLAEGPAHCGECHTPRNPIGGLAFGQWMGGAISAEGDGKVPNITPHAKGIKDWSASDIASSLESGFTPSFDSFGSSMADVQENMAKLTKEDRDAIAAYLKVIPAVAPR